MIVCPEVDADFFFSPYSWFLDVSCFHRWGGVQGCSVFVTKFTRAAHEERECVNRFFPCENNCGVFVQLHDLEHHNAEVCIKRKIECPNGCGMEFRAEALELHNDGCLQQPLPCGVGAAPCVRRLGSWLQVCDCLDRLLSYGNCIVLGHCGCIVPKKDWRCCSVNAGDVSPTGQSR